ncbi:hypothetical protein Q8A73_014757 [Channa argus]|nr:hypothetical protein Q8A73_014757 [Channa argus]
MLPSKLGVKVEGDEHPDSMVLSVLISQAEALRLCCFPSAPHVHASRKSESGGVVMPITMKWGVEELEWDKKRGGAQSSGEMLQVVACIQKARGTYQKIKSKREQAGSRQAQSLEESCCSS